MGANHSLLRSRPWVLRLPDPNAPIATPTHSNSTMSSPFRSATDGSTKSARVGAAVNAVLEARHGWSLNSYRDVICMLTARALQSRRLTATGYSCAGEFLHGSRCCWGHRCVEHHGRCYAEGVAGAEADGPQGAVIGYTVALPIDDNILERHAGITVEAKVVGSKLKSCCQRVDRPLYPAGCRWYDELDVDGWWRNEVVTMLGCVALTLLRCQISRLLRAPRIDIDLGARWRG